MRGRHILLFSIVPVLLSATGATLIWLAAKVQDSVDFRETNYSAIEARAKTIDKLAQIPEDANNSASALGRIIISSDNKDRAHIQFLKSLAHILFFLAALQAIIIVSVARGSVPSNKSRQPDAKVPPK